MNFYFVNVQQSVYVFTSFVCLSYSTQSTKTWDLEKGTRMTHESALNVSKCSKSLGVLQEQCVNLKWHYSWNLKRMAKKLTTGQLFLLGGGCV